jgi:hypothetical protein
MRAFRRWSLSIWLLGALACTGGAPVESASQIEQVLARFSLRDYLDRDWHNELVSFKVDANLIGRKDVSLLDADQHPVPFQWQTGSTAGITFLASVPRFSQIEYALVQSRPPAMQNLAVREDADSLELGNEQIAIRLNRGARALRQGPIGGLRLSSGKWVGDGELHWTADSTRWTAMVGDMAAGEMPALPAAGTAAPPSCRVNVVADGPVFAEAESEYAFPGEGYWRLRFRVIAGEPVVLVDEQFSGPSEASYRLQLGVGFEPDHALWRGNKESRSVSVLSDLAGHSALVLEPWLEWWQPTQGNWLAFYGEHSPDLLAVGAREAACWVEPGKTGWNTGITVDKSSPTLQFQLRGFERKWMCMVLPKDSALQPSKDSAPLPQQYLIKHSDLPLNRVKDYVLAWPDAGLGHPRLFVTPNELQAFRARFKADTNHLAQLRRSAVFMHSLDDYITNSLGTGDPEVEQRLTEFALKQLQSAVDLYVRQAVYPTQGAYPHEHYNEVTPALNALDAILQPGVLSPEQRACARAQLAFLGYTLASPSNYSPERGFKANPNMTTAIRCELGVLACLIPDHPKAREWAEMGIREMANELETWTGPNGGWLEAPHYATVTLDSIVSLTLALRQTSFGDTDWALHPKLKEAVRWLARISTPRDARLGGQRRMPEIGNTYTGERTCLTGWLARLWKEKDPAFARQMQWMWREQGSFTKPGIGGLYPGVMGYSAVMFDPSVPAEAPKWGSEWFPEAGAVLRAHFPSDCETYLHYIQGRLHQHYDYDEGSFILWGKGQPLCEDFGYYGRAPAADHSRVDDGFDEQVGREGRIVEFVPGEQTDYLHGERAGWHRQILFVKDKDCLGPNYFVIRDTLTNGRPADWRVWIATDTIPNSGAGVPPVSGAGVPPATSLNSVVNPPLDPSVPIRVRGRFGVDLVVYFVETSSGTLSTEVLSRTTGVSGFKTLTTTQHSLHLRLQPNATVTAVLYPLTRTQPVPEFARLDGGRVVKIKGDFGTDYVFLGFGPFDFRQGSLAFHGERAAVQLRSEGVHLGLSGQGALRYKSRALTNDTNTSTTALIRS